MTNNSETQQNFRAFGQKTKNFGKATAILYVLNFIFLFLIASTFSTEIYSDQSFTEVLNKFNRYISSIQWIAAISLVIIDIYAIIFLMQINKIDMNFGRIENSSKKIIILFSISILLDGIITIAIFNLLHDFIDKLPNVVDIYSGNSDAFAFLISDYYNSLQFISFLSLIPFILRIGAYNMLQDELRHLPSFKQPANYQKKENLLDGFNKAKIGEFLLLISTIIPLILSEESISGLISLIGSIIIMVGLIKAGNGLTRYTYATYPLESIYQPNPDEGHRSNISTTINIPNNQQTAINPQHAIPFGHSSLTQTQKSPATNIALDGQKNTDFNSRVQIEYCSQCGSQLKEDKPIFCSSCGNKVNL